MHFVNDLEHFQFHIVRIKHPKPAHSALPIRRYNISRSNFLALRQSSCKKGNLFVSPKYTQETEAPVWRRVWLAQTLH